MRCRRRPTRVGPDTLTRITRASAEALRAWCGEVEVRAAPKGVAVLKRGQIARADIPRPLSAEIAPANQRAKNPGLAVAKVAADAADSKR